MSRNRVCGPIYFDYDPNFYVTPEERGCSCVPPNLNFIRLFPQGPEGPEGPRGATGPTGPPGRCSCTLHSEQSTPGLRLPINPPTTALQPMGTLGNIRVTPGDAIRFTTSALLDLQACPHLTVKTDHYVTIYLYITIDGHLVSDMAIMKDHFWRSEIPCGLSGTIIPISWSRVLIPTPGTRDIGMGFHLCQPNPGTSNFTCTLSTLDMIALVAQKG